MVSLWLLGDLFDLWEDDDDDGGGGEEPDPGQELEGRPDIDDDIVGGSGDDTITGDWGDADSLTGGAGDDLLQLGTGNTGQGDAGADTFSVYLDATVTDFTPGEDHLDIVNYTDRLYEDAPDAYRWDVAEDGVSLIRIGGETGTESTVVTLDGLTTPPDPADFSETRIDDRLEETISVAGDQMNFVQDIAGTDGADDLTLDHGFTHWTLDAGAGDDTVFDEALNTRIDLGDGDDLYQSSTDYAAIDTAHHTVLGGAGNDTIEGAVMMLTADGGAGDDVFNLTDYVDYGSATVTGGDGDDSFVLGMNGYFTGGAGADSFTVETPYAAIRIMDFDPVEDALILAVPPDYAGAGEVTLRDNGDGTTTVQLDGLSYVELETVLADLSGIAVVTSASAVA
ncbi:MAG: hypothetical protein R3D85_02095 [Paracoccaceae bacterium]